MFSLSANLASQGIPLVTDRSVMLTEASINFAMNNGKPEFFLGGQISLEPGGNPIMPSLHGQVSIDVKGTLYGEAWMARGEWKNPFNLNPNISVTAMGLGFGINLATTPIPTPILAMEGGIIVRDKMNAIRFSGSATFGVDLGNPTRNMIDAEIAQLYVSDLVDVFAPNGLPSTLANELRKVELSAAHLTIVPPGPGVTLFDVHYKPGFMAMGALKYSGKPGGAFYIQSNEEGLEAYGGLTPIIFSGFSFTGTKPGSGPEMFLIVKPPTVAFALNGNLTVMDVSTKTDIYVSDTGFNVTLEGNIFNTFHTSLQVAGNDILRGENLYVKAMMKDEGDLVQKISKEASDAIYREANRVQAEYTQAAQSLELMRPQLELSASELTQKQDEVRVIWMNWCNLLNQRATQDAERIRLEQQVLSFNNEINQMEATLASQRYARAVSLNAITCSGNSKPFQDYCYSPKPGYQWDILQPINGSRATFIPEKKEQTAAQVQGNFTLLGGCPGGQWGDALTGKCYSCPSGYQRDGLSNLCYRIIPIDYQPAERGAYIGCGSGNSFPDLGECWQCPSGYERKVSLEPITSDKACELIDLFNREGAIRDKRIELAAIEVNLNLINKGIGELATQLTGVATDVCNNISNTDAINADPAVAPYFAKWASLSLQVNEFQSIVKTVRDTQVGALTAAAWIVEHGGNALGVVDIDHAEFEGCLSNTEGGIVALKVNGKFAGNPLDASFTIDLKSPEQFIQEFGRTLLGTPNPTTTHSNGGCTAPHVSAPLVNSDNIKEMMKFVNEGKEIQLQPRPRRSETPAWAAEKRM